MSRNLTISRRTVLRGVGTAVALPWLEAMAPRTARAAAPAATAPSTTAPLRAAFLFVPNGKIMDQFTPDHEGELHKLPATLAPLEKHKQQLLVLSGLTLNAGRSLGDGAGDHARNVASFLTGAHPHKTAGKDIYNGVSVDQIAAAKIGRHTRIPSLELGCEPTKQRGRCDSGYSCVYTSNISWRSPTQYVTKEINPQAVFDRLFGTGDRKEDAAARAKRLADNQSVLDFALEDAAALHKKLGRVDRRKLDEYLHAVRQVEQGIARAEKLGKTEAHVPDFPRPAGVPEEMDQHVRQMMDIMVLAMQTDSTRVLSFMYTNAGSNRSYPQIGVRGGHHEMSHHKLDQEKIKQIAKINRHHVGHLAYFIDRLSKVEEGGASLLDHSMIFYGSGISDGNRHKHHDLPILLAGGAGGALKSGRHLVYPTETPLTNLYRSMLDKMGAPVKQIGDSTGMLPNLWKRA
jgi:hypothetical protein